MNAKEKTSFMKASRVRVGLSQEKAAELIGVSRQTLSYYEAYPYSMSMESFAKMKELYGEEFANIYFAEKLYKK
jgi:DNA-binding XRE family transcriptional regulator